MATGWQVGRQNSVDGIIEGQAGGSLDRFRREGRHETPLRGSAAGGQVSRHSGWRGEVTIKSGEREQAGRKGREERAGSEVASDFLSLTASRGILVNTWPLGVSGVSSA